MFRLPIMGRHGVAGIILFIIILVSTTQINFHPAVPHYPISRIFRSSSSTVPTSSTRSGWFSEGGFLRFNATHGWETQYEVREAGAKGYTCDEEEETSGGEMVCVNTLRLSRSIHDNSAAQNRSRDVLTGDEKDEMILRQSYEKLGGLRGKRVLYLGDSIDRYAVDDFAEDLPTASRLNILPENGKVIPGPINGGWTTRFFNLRIAETPPTSPIPEYDTLDPLHPDDFRIDFIFSFGIVFFKTPAKLLERVAMLDHVLAEDRKYDLIILDSGMWDINKIEENYPGITPAQGLPRDILTEYIQLYVSLIEAIRARYGSTIPFAIRPTHSVSPALTENKHNPLRAEHLRQAQIEAARRAGVTVLPFARLMRNQVNYYRGDGYHPAQAANMVHMETVLRLVAEV